MVDASMSDELLDMLARVQPILGHRPCVAANREVAHDPQVELVVGSRIDRRVEPHQRGRRPTA